MDIGVHCAVCGKLDFLPFDCHKCGKSFCLNDRQHNCASPPIKEKQPERVDTIQKKNHKDTFTPINGRLSAKPEACSPARSSAHLAAQPQSDKKGNKLGGSSAPKTERARAALDRLKNLIEVKFRPTKSASRTLDRINASGDALIPQHHRVYFTVERVEHEYTDELTKSTVIRQRKVKTMFFDRDMSAGRILDQASKHLALPHARLQDAAKNELDLSVTAEQLPKHLLICP